MKYGDSKDARTVENGSGSAIELRPIFKVFVLTITTSLWSIILKTFISESATGVGDIALQIGDHPAWNVIITKMNFQNQMKIAQLNQRLADMVQINAEYELGFFQRHILDEKYM